MHEIKRIKMFTLSRFQEDVPLSSVFFFRTLLGTQRLASTEAGINLKREGPGLLALKVVAAGPAALERGVRVVEGLVVDVAVSTVRGTVLVEVVRVEELARGEGVETLEDGLGLVGKVLLPGVVCADLRVEGSGEELAAHPVLGAVNGLGAAVGSGAPVSRGSGNGGA